MSCSDLIAHYHCLWPIICNTLLNIVLLIIMIMNNMCNKDNLLYNRQNK